MNPRNGHDLPRETTHVDNGLLCLKCRRSGHIVKDCTATEWQHELYWAFSPDRKLLNFDFDLEQDRSGFCERCNALDIPELLSNPVWKSRPDLNGLAGKNPPHFLFIW